MKRMMGITEIGDESEEPHRVASEKAGEMKHSRVYRGGDETFLL